MWRKDKTRTSTWMTATRSRTRQHVVRSHGFRFRGQYEEEIKQELEQGGAEITAGIPGENAAGKQR